MIQVLHIAKYNAEVRESFASREKSKVTGIISNLAAISIENKVNQRLPEMRRSREKKNRCRLCNAHKPRGE